MARKDKARFEFEKAMYKGPWKVPAKLKKNQKDPNVPRRPMSAFLSYSNAKRPEAKEAHPEMNNAEMSRFLAQMWRNAPQEEKQEFIDREYELRQKYLSDIAIWRENIEKELSEQRKHREELAMKAVAAGHKAPQEETMEEAAEATPEQNDEHNESSPSVARTNSPLNSRDSSSSPLAKTLSAKAVLTAALTGKRGDESPSQWKSPRSGNPSPVGSEPAPSSSDDNGPTCEATNSKKPHLNIQQPTLDVEPTNFSGLFDQPTLSDHDDDDDNLLGESTGLPGIRKEEKSQNQTFAAPARKEHFAEVDDEDDDDDGRVNLQKMFVAIFNEQSECHEEPQVEQANATLLSSLLVSQDDGLCDGVECSSTIKDIHTQFQNNSDISE